MNGRVEQLIGTLADRRAFRTEAMAQADIRELLLAAPLGLDDRQVVSLEAPVGERRRIDVEVGFMGHRGRQGGRAQSDPHAPVAANG